MKRVLVVSYYFPPSGGPGVQRVLKFVKYLPAFGWQPTVLTVDPASASYPDLDPTLEAEIPPGIRVVRTKAWDPYAAYARLQGKAKAETIGVGFAKEEAEPGWQQRLARWLRANIFVPDARIGWVPFAWKAGRDLLQRQPFDVLFTSGPPHSTHLAGWLLKRRFGLPWVADMRDPWTDISYYHELPRTEVVQKLEAALERAVLGSADAVLSVSDGVGRLLESKTPIRHYETIPNGFDPHDIPDAPSKEKTEEVFRIAHVGTLTASQQVPGLIEALAKLASDDPAFRKRLRVRFVGHVDSVIIHAFHAAGLGETLELVPYVPHPEAIAHMREADLLLVAVQRVVHNEGVTPAKMFEYLSLGIPVLGLAPPDGDLGAILRETNGGGVFRHEDAAGIAAFMAHHAERVQRGEPASPPDAQALQRYNRHHLTGQLAALFDTFMNREQ